MPILLQELLLVRLRIAFDQILQLRQIVGQLIVVPHLEAGLGGSICWGGMHFSGDFMMEIYTEKYFNSHNASKTRMDGERVRVKNVVDSWNRTECHAKTRTKVGKMIAVLECMRSMVSLHVGSVYLFIKSSNLKPFCKYKIIKFYIHYLKIENKLFPVSKIMFKKDKSKLLNMNNRTANNMIYSKNKSNINLIPKIKRRNNGF